MDFLSNLTCPKCRQMVDPVTRICALGHHFGAPDVNVITKEVEKSMVRCPLQSTNDCKWIGSIANAALHCKQCHYSNFSSLRKRYLLLSAICESKISYFNVLFNVYGKLFKTVIEIDSDTGFVIWRVICMGSNEEAEDYYFEVNLKNLHNGDEIYRTASCQAINGYGIAKGRMYVVTDLSLVRRFCKNGKLFCSITIYKENDTWEDDSCVNNINVISPQPCASHKSVLLPSVKHLRSVTFYGSAN